MINIDLQNQEFLDKITVQKLLKLQLKTQEMKEFQVHLTLKVDSKDIL